MTIFLEWVKDVCMVVCRCSIEEVYDGNLVGIFYDCVCNYFLYRFYDNVDVED